MALAHRIAAGTAVFALFGVSACSSGTPAAPAAAPAAAATGAPVSSTASAKEVQWLTSVRPRVDKLVSSLQAKDLAAAKAAYADYDAGWNGVEVYVNVRDINLYTSLEKDLQDPIGAALAAPSPDYAALATKAQQLGTTYDKAIALGSAGPALSPLFDDVASLRGVRSDLRRVTNDLKAGDVTAAKQHFTTFAAGYPTVQSLVTARSDYADGQISASVKAVQDAFAAGAAADSLTPLVATVTARYNYAVSLLNVAARNADLTKTAVAQPDVEGVKALRGIEKSLDASLTAWKAGDFAGATAAAKEADTAWDALEPSLKDRKAVPETDKALDAYIAEAAAAGDATKVPADATTAKEDALVTEQALVGQFWADPTVHQATSA